ncbi:MAG: DUF1214 domain-containing protein [Pseudomonadota bacterium]
MKRAALLAVMALIGIALGAASALMMSGLWSSKKPMEFGDIDVDGWVSDFAVGSNAASPYVRARVARHGLLALAKSEAVYFVRDQDNSGERLRAECTYRLSGTDMPASWWSVTLYNTADSMLPFNEDGALSVDATSIIRPDQATSGPWQAIIAPQRPADAPNWISSRGSEGFDLLLRLYVPENALLSDPQATLPPPSIELLRCKGEGA